MSRGFFGSNKDIDSEAEIAHSSHWDDDTIRDFRARMERKLAYKQSIAGARS